MDANEAPTGTAGGAASTRLKGPAGESRDLTNAGLMVLLAAYLMTMMDTFIVNIALPTIGDELSLGTAQLEMVVAGYSLSLTTFLVMGGRLGDMWGRRRVLAIGLIGFTIASLLCGVATEGWQLVAYRIIQAACAALILPQVLGTIQATTTGAARHRAQSLYASTGGIALAFGQVLGGLLLTANIADTSWRSLFWVNVPVGVAVIAALAVVPENRTRTVARVDWVGTALLTTTLLLALVPLSQGRSLGWPWWLWPLLVAAPISAIVLWRAERAVEHRGRLPLLSPRLLITPGVHRGLGVAIPFFIGFGGFLFVFALTVQHYLGHDPLPSALALLPAGITFFAGAFLTRRRIQRIGSRTLVVGGLTQIIGLIATATPVLALHTGVSLWGLVPGLSIMGLGLAMIFGASFHVVLAAVPIDMAGAGSGVLVTTQQAALTAGVALVGSLYEFVAQRHNGAVGFGVATGLQILFALYICAVERGLRSHVRSG